MIVLALLIALLCQPAWAKGPDLGDIGFDQRPGATVPLDTVLRAEDGTPVTLKAAMRTRPTVLALGYFHCTTLCGVVRADLLDGLSRSGLRAGSDYTLLAVSIDPSETAADAAAARRQENARYPLPGNVSSVQYLTGDAAAIETAVGFHARFDQDTKQFLHPAGLVFLNTAGTVSGYLLGVGYKPGELRAGILRARDGGIAKAVLPVLLLCFHFDPATGRYTLAVMRLLQIAGGLTVLTVGGTIMLALRKERR
jgi:protein SCO1/2